MVVLFDFDGVIMDTETQYTLFWNKIGEQLFNRKEFGMTVKGLSLTLIYGRFFTGEFEKLIPEMNMRINELEQNMPYEYIKGVDILMQELKAKGIKSAIVTSSNDLKMQLVFKKHPYLRNLVDYVITENQFTHSKPHPECYQLAMKKLNVSSSEAVVFEDSIYGIEAGKAAGAFVIGVATTNGREQIEKLTDYVIDDFEGMTLDKLKQICKR